MLNSEKRLRNLGSKQGCSLYEIEGDSGSVRCFLASTAESRLVCNDPSVFGLNYTSALQKASSSILTILRENSACDVTEHESLVLHLLRGGLNFGLREALGESFGWNSHASAFMSAQRSRDEKNEEEWRITESNYKKVQVPPVCSIFFGDVVATGTSCDYALRSICDSVESQNSQIRHIFFVTIGGPRALESMKKVDEKCKARFSQYEGSTVIYLEGIFSVASAVSDLSIKITGTDLLRRDSLLAPEFLESQYEAPSYPLERCTIYDAGSRAFWLPEYLQDVREYWEHTLLLAEKGATFSELLAERCPQLSLERFPQVDLIALCKEQVKKFYSAVE